MYQLAIVIGSMAAPLVSYLIVNWAPAATAWRWMFASELLPVAVFLVLLLFLPQSPRWLAGRGRMDEALDVLVRVDGPEFARTEMQQIQAALQEESGGFADLFAPGVRYALLIGLLLAFFNNWTGWSVMGGYIPMLFEASGMQDRAMVFLQYAVTYGFMGAVTVLACWTVDRWGRRPLWLIASALMILVTALTGAVFHFHLSGWPVLVVILLCTVPHGLALGPLPWLMMSEIFPIRLRGRGVPDHCLFVADHLCRRTTVSLDDRLFGEEAGIGGGRILVVLRCVPAVAPVRLENAARNQRENARRDRCLVEETMNREPTEGTGQALPGRRQFLSALGTGAGLACAAGLPLPGLAADEHFSTLETTPAGNPGGGRQAGPSRRPPGRNRGGRASVWRTSTRLVRQGQRRQLLLDSSRAASGGNGAGLLRQLRLAQLGRRPHLAGTGSGCLSAGLSVA